MTETDNTPAEALEAIARSRRAVHDRVTAGGWRYDVIYSAVFAGMVGAQVLDAPFNVVGLTLGVLALSGMFQAETRRIGLHVTGVSPRQARWVAIAMGAVMAAVMLAVVALKYRTATPPALIAAGSMSLAFVVALVGSRQWRRVYRAEMGADR